MITSRTKEDVEKEMLGLREEVRHLNKRIQELTNEKEELNLKILLAKADIKRVLYDLDKV